jgi:ABC-type nitrate/sulfonate/bicarbonate transport system ATPase subunit
LNALSHAGASALDLAIRRKDHTRPDGVAHHVLADFRLTLPVGAVGALVGPSGCGKTTLLRLVAGLDQNYDGEIHLPAHGRLGMVFQEPRLLPWRTVIDNLRIAAPQAHDDALAALLDELGLAEHATHFPRQLSLGLARRVALARALAIEPDLLLLDEPLVSLDAALARDLREKIAALIETRRITTLIVTHDLREAIALADKIFLLSPRPAHVVATLEIDTPRTRLTPARADELERTAMATLSGGDAHHSKS